MRSRRSHGAWILAAAAAAAGCRPPSPTTTVDTPATPAAKPSAPVAAREPVTTVRHGRTFVDAYAWLRNRDDPRTRAYLDAENAFAAKILEPLTPLHDALVAEMRARVVGDDRDPPVRHGGFDYVTRRVAGTEYWVVERTAVGAGPVQVVLDANLRARGHDYYDVGGFTVSPDHQRLAWGEDTSGDERYRVLVIDIATGRSIDELDEPAGASMAWSADSRTLWTTRLDEAHREYQLWRNEPGSGGAPVLSREEDDLRFSLSVARSRDDRWLQLVITSALTSEVHIMDAKRPKAAWRVLEPRRQGIEYDVEHHGDRLFMRTNEGAPEFEVREAVLTKTGHTPWRRFATPAAGETFTGVDVFADHVVVSGRASGLPQIWIHPLEGGARHAITWPDAAYQAYVDDNPEFHSKQLRLGYSSPVSPPSTLAFAMDRKVLTVLEQDPVPEFDASALVLERFDATADDGTAIPITLVRRRDAPGPGPLVLRGYGAYGSSSDADFSRGDLPLLDRGIAIAVAHVRGGGEFGKAWHDGGKLAAKVNSFTDFIRVAEALIARGDTRTDQLAIMGGSAGGLLVGASVNMRPDLFAAVVAEVPFVDVINTMEDATLPLTAAEWEEWGNPEVAAQLAVMAGYSPYDNVAPREYPAMLVTAGYNDPRVGYWEPAKWVAKLRATTTGDAPLLLRTQMGSGHSGTTGRYSALDEHAWVLAFVVEQLEAARPKG